MQDRLAELFEPQQVQDIMRERFYADDKPAAKASRKRPTSRAEHADRSYEIVCVSLYKDDLAQLDAGMALYDAFHLWCRDATEEVHNWPGPGAR